MIPPSAEDWRAYQAGTLDAQAWQEIEAWLDQHPESIPLEDAEGQAHPGLADILNLSSEAPVFQALADRIVDHGELGEGGMARVHRVFDQALDRCLALKICRPRSAQESLAAWHWRLQRFRREAILTARLEHPSILTVHDMGRDQYGNPALLCQYLDGQSFAEILRLGRLDLSEGIRIVSQVAEALSYAHAQGIIHRDCTPNNIIVGAYGAVTLIDWGLAAECGDQVVESGTPGWMPPELTASATEVQAHPTQDVYALGRLLETLLAVVHTPCSSLSALARHCCHEDPQQRPQHAAAVIEELRRWLRDGLTRAERPGPWRYLTRWLRRHPREAIFFLVLLIITCAGALGYHVQRQQAREQLARAIQGLEESLTWDDADQLRAAEQQLYVLDPQQHLADSRDFILRVHAAQDVLQRQEQLAASKQRLRTQLLRLRRSGPWSGELADRRATLQEFALYLDPQHIAHDSAILRSHEYRSTLLTAVVQLLRASILLDPDSPLSQTLQRLLEQSTDDPAWQALAELLQQTQRGTHELLLPRQAGELLEQVLSKQELGEILLETYRPNQRLLTYAREHLEENPGAFWPRLITAQAALRQRQLAEAQLHALIAHGREPSSIWPLKVLAYVALLEEDTLGLEQWSRRALEQAPENREIIAQRAVVYARRGDRAAALDLIQAYQLAGHLRYHIEHPVGHPMEWSAQALVDAGLQLPEAPAHLDHLVPE